MKLQKAVEKAKKARDAALQQDTRQPEAVQEAPQKVTEEKAPAPKQSKPADPPLRAAPGSKQWRQPAYTQSHYHELDREKAIQNRCVCLFPESEELEFYKILRTQIQHRAKAQGWNTVMITSARPEEGKTLTSINLAITMAKEFNQTVLLVDADLKRQNIHRYLGIPSKQGLINYLAEDMALKDLITWPNIDNLTLISGGGLVRDSAELLGSPKMKALVQEMKNRYDDRYVLFDAPPVLAGADAIAFAPLVDCIVMVVEEGQTTNKDIQKVLELIPKEKLLGFVLNKCKSPVTSYYKYY